MATSPAVELVPCLPTAGLRRPTPICTLKSPFLRSQSAGLACSLRRGKSTRFSDSSGELAARHGIEKDCGLSGGVKGALRPRCATSSSSSSSAAGGVSVSMPEIRVNSVLGVLFDMDGVLCDSEHCSREAGVALFAEMGYSVTVEDFIPFMGTGNSLYSNLLS